VRQLAEGNVNWGALLWGRSEVERRRALKDLSLRLPLRPLVRFIYMYFFLGGVLDGRAGFTWCVLQAFYEYLILLKVWELKHDQPIAPIALACEAGVTPPAVNTATDSLVELTVNRPVTVTSGP
jgi:hypothetical protein